MLKKVAEKVGEVYLTTATDPEVKSIPWPMILALIIQVLEQLIPLLDQWCPEKPGDVRDLATQLKPMAGLSWRQRKKFSAKERWAYWLFRRNVRRCLDCEMDQDDFETALLEVGTKLTDDEIDKCSMECA